MGRDAAVELYAPFDPSADGRREEVADALRCEPSYIRVWEIIGVTWGPMCMLVDEMDGRSIQTKIRVALRDRGINPGRWTIFDADSGVPRIRDITYPYCYPYR